MVYCVRWCQQLIPKREKKKNLVKVDRFFYFYFQFPSFFLFFFCSCPSLTEPIISVVIEL
jgi:hypothetical protein